MVHNSFDFQIELCDKLVCLAAMAEKLFFLLLVLLLSKKQQKGTD